MALPQQRGLPQVLDLPGLSAELHLVERLPLELVKLPLLEGPLPGGGAHQGGVGQAGEDTQFAESV